MTNLRVKIVLAMFLLGATINCQGPTEPIGQTELKAPKPVIICYEHDGIIDTLIIPSQ